MYSILKTILYPPNKGKRNAIFILLLVFSFPAIALINYSLEIQSGLISKSFRFLNLLISFLLIFEFIFSPRFKAIFSIKFDKKFVTQKIPIILFLFFWAFYLFRMVLDLEVYHVNDVSDISKSYYYLFAIGITIIPMLAVATINQLNFDFLQLSLHRYLVGLNICLIAIFVIDRLYNNHVGYRFIVSRNEFDYLDAITIAVYGSLLVLSSFLNKKKSFLNYVCIVLGFFMVLTTASRGPILSILLALLFVLFFKDKKLSIKYLFLTLALTSSVLFNYLFSVMFDKYFIAGNPLLHRLNNFGKDQSTVNRLKILEDGFNQFLEGPIFGTHFLVMESKMYAHNILLDILLATGVLGLLMIIPVFLIFARKIISKFQIVFVSVIGFYLFLNTLTSGACYNMTEFWIIMILLVLYKNTTNDNKLKQLN